MTTATFEVINKVDETFSTYFVKTVNFLFAYLE